MKERKTFVKGAAILGVAGLLVQVMGAVFRIPLGNIIGQEGMGYFQTAYPLYVFLLVFSTNGAPAAISKMTSERIALGQYREAHRTFKLSFLLMLVLGVVAFALVFIFAKPLVVLFGNEGAYLAMVAISPALLFVPVMAVFRGYFQGLQEMEPTATSQLVEQAIRVAVGLTLAIVLLPRGMEIAAAGATFGTSVGPIAGVVLLIIIYMHKRKRVKGLIIIDENTKRESSRSILTTLAKIAIPMTIGVSILPIMNIADVAITMQRLQDTGILEKEANNLYSLLTGFAGPVINIPMALALSIALSMVPAIAAANSVKDYGFLDTNIKLGLRMAMIIGVPCTFGLMALAEPIMLLLYPMQASAATDSANCLFYLSIGVIFLAIAQTMAGVLQGLGRPGIAVISLGVGLIVKCIATYILVGIPSLNISGAAIASSIAYIVIGVLNFIGVKKLTNVKFNVSLSIIKPLVAGIVMCVCVVGVYYGLFAVLGNSISTILSIGVGGLVYIIMLLKIKAIEANEIKILPKGEKLLKILEKIKLM